MVGFIIGGGFLILLSLGLLLYKKKVEAKILNLKYHDNTDIQSVLNACLSIGKEVGTGHFSKMVKVSGKTGIDRPLKGEFSKSPCVYYEAQVDHTFERSEEAKDNNGRTIKKWVAQTEKIASEKKGGEFWLIDNSGRITLNIEGANLVLKEAIRNKKPALRQVDFSFTQYLPISNETMRSTGYIEIERNLKIGENLFVMGELHDREGTPKISKPLDRSENFVISTRSEEEVIKGLASQVKMLLYGSIIIAVVGVSLLITGLI